MNENKGKNIFKTDFTNIFRINFIGRPFELNRLVYDDKIIISNQQEADTILRAFRTFYGFQYLGNFCSFFLNLMFYFKSKNKQYSIKKLYGLLFIGLLPGVVGYVGSNFFYWDMIRPIVLLGREREKKYKHLESYEREQYQIVYKASKDFHKYIQENSGVIKSVLTIFKLI